MKIFLEIIYCCSNHTKMIKYYSLYISHETFKKTLFRIDKEKNTFLNSKFNLLKRPLNLYQLAQDFARWLYLWNASILSHETWKFFKRNFSTKSGCKLIVFIQKRLNGTAKYEWTIVRIICKKVYKIGTRLKLLSNFLEAMIHESERESQCVICAQSLPLLVQFLIVFAQRVSVISASQSHRHGPLHAMKTSSLFSY